MLLSKNIKGRLNIDKYLNAIKNIKNDNHKYPIDVACSIQYFNA